MTISLKDRLTMQATIKQTPSPEPYQDAVAYPCFSPGGIVTSDDTTQPTVTPQQPGSTGLTNTEKLLQRLLDIEGGGAIPGTYRSITVTIPANEQRYEVQLSIYATQFHMRCDQDVLLSFNSPQFDPITFEVGDFPLSISGLRMNESIRSVYITTSTDTEVKIIAFGSVV
jgi:hypothetical protein